jgi:hypothetical protein
VAADLDEGTYASILEQLMPLLRSANGFISQAGGPSPSGGIVAWSRYSNSLTQRALALSAPQEADP